MIFQMITSSKGFWTTYALEELPGLIFAMNLSHMDYTCLEPLTDFTTQMASKGTC
jgi:hypothetical protein